jgi:hypothetical protein
MQTRKKITKYNKTKAQLTKYKLIHPTLGEMGKGDTKFSTHTHNYWEVKPSYAYVKERISKKVYDECEIVKLTYSLGYVELIKTN